MLRRILPLSLVVVAASACGPTYLTPELVREHLAAPKGAVSQDSLPRATRSFFRAKEATAAEAQAFFVKGVGKSGGTTAQDDGVAEATGGGMMQSAVGGGAETASDVLCAASLVANVSEFEACEEGRDCDVDLTIDACVLRIGENPDPNARGSIHFKLKHTIEPEDERVELRITFDEFQLTDDEDGEVLRRLDGIIALETTTHEDADLASAEVIFSADLDFQKKITHPDFFEDSVLERARLTAALRFTGDETATDAQGKLEILCFVDESDDARDESVSLVLQAESHHLESQDLTTAAVAIEVHGSNGSFACTWSAAEQDLGPDGDRVTSQGECTDENGDTFTFSSVVTEGGEAEPIADDTDA
jgi:hypothetical protein